MSILTNREKFSLYSILYINLHLFILFYNYHLYPQFLINFINLYSIIDIIWLFYDNKVKISKYELISHHISAIFLVNSNIDIHYKLQILIIEITTLLLLLLRISNNYIKNILYYLFTISWIFFRIVWLYIFIIKCKYLQIYLNYNGYHGIELFMLLNIYLLGIKWTLDFAKITKHISYSSIMLSFPLIYNIYIIPNYLFLSLFN